MKTYAMLLSLFMISFNVFSQSPESLQKTAMAKLEWMTGNWKGTAVTRTGPGKSDTIAMHEVLTYNLDSTIMTVEGKGYHIMNGKTLPGLYHHAFAVLSFDNNSKYQWKAWRVPGGIYTEYAPEIEGHTFSWRLKTGQGTLRFHVQFEDNGQWHEMGEFSADGNNWYPFFDMILSHVK